MKLKFVAWSIAAFASWSLTATGLLAQCQSCEPNSYVGSWPSQASQVTGNMSSTSARGAWRNEAAVQGQKIEARNEAWMRPFNCRDRQAYFSVWSPMVDGGWITQCTLNDAHFNDAGNLNEFGEKKIATIMMNFPIEQRMVRIAPTRDGELGNQRLEEVRSVVNRWYGEEMANQVALTHIVPTTFSGRRVEAVNAGYSNQLPAPMISTGSSGSGTGGSAGSSADAGAGSGG